MSQESRALSVFLSAIKTSATKQAYLYWLNKYLAWLGKTEFDELITYPLPEAQRNIENYLLDLRKQGKPRGTIEAMIYPLFLFYQMNDYAINTIKIKKLFPAQTVKVGGTAYTRDQTAKILLTLGKKQKLKPVRNKAIIHFMAASGCRVGAIPELKLSHIKKVKDSYFVKIYAGSNSEYVTFLTPEASYALTKYLDKRKALQDKILPDDSLFNISYSAVRAMVTRLAKKAQVVTKQNNGRFDIPVNHGFRKRWNTQLKQIDKINPILIEKIFGHNVIALDQNYLKPTDERLHEEYKKGIKALTVFRQYRQKPEE